MPKAVWPLLKLTERQHHSPSQVNSDEIPFKLAEPHTPLPPQEIEDGFRRQISPNRRVTCCMQEVAYTPLHRIQETGGRLRTFRSNQACCPHKTKPPPHPLFQACAQGNRLEMGATIPLVPLSKGGFDGLKARQQHTHRVQVAKMPRKLPSSYIRKLNEQREVERTIEVKRVEKKQEPKGPDSGKLKGFTMICQTCGTRAKFTVDTHGYATCTNCRAIANFRFGHLA